MTTIYQVKTTDVVISDALLKKAADYGWMDRAPSGTWWPWLVLALAEKSCLGNYKAYDLRYETVTIAEFIALLKKGPPKPKEPDIIIGGNVVIFRPTGIEVGFLFIPTETIDAIHARHHASDSDAEAS